MKTNRIIGFCFIALSCFLTTGCFSIEQEIFLKSDGSGEFVLHFSIPDLPEELKKGAPSAGPQANPVGDLDQFAKELTTLVSTNVKLKEVKKVKQNGAQGIYMVFEFKDLRDVNSVLANFGKDSLKDSDFNARPQWTVQLDRAASRSVYSGIFLLDLSEGLGKKQPAKKTAPVLKQGEPGDQMAAEFEKLGEQMMMMFMGTVKLRFVLHAPSPIVESNADIILNGRSAVWNCSPAAFIKEKKAIQMKASF